MSLEVEGVTPAMLVALGEAGIKTLEDLAGCATDDLLGYYEVTKEKERVRIPGALESFNLTPDDANAIIMDVTRQNRLDRSDAGRGSARRRRRSGYRGGRHGVTETASLELEDDDALRERRCIVTGEVLPESQLIRFVADPEGRIVPDVAADLPGRGIWVSAIAAKSWSARSPRSFSRAAAKAQVTADADLADRTEAQLVARMSGDLGMARRSGRARAGLRQCRPCAGRQPAPGSPGGGVRRRGGRAAKTRGNCGRAGP